MNPLQQAFVEAFKAWDGEAMATALIVLAETCSGMPLTDATKADIAWSCRGLLDKVLTSYFQTSWPINVPEVPLRLLLNTDVEVPENEGRVPYPRLTLTLNISNQSSATLKARWQEMGIIGTDIVLERNKVKTPHSLRGEPGYPSIYLPKSKPIIEVTQTYAHALSVKAGYDSPLSQRYRAGECKQVWHELTAMGEDVRKPDVLPHAMAVVREMMQRCRVNVKRLHTRLQAEHYQFANPEIMFLPPEADILQRIAYLEQRLGPLPLSLCAWYELVGSVNFVIETEDTSNSIAVLHPLVVLPAQWVLYYKEDKRDREDSNRAIDVDYFHTISLDNDQVDVIASSGFYGFALPNAGIDIVLDDGTNHITFVDYLRRAFGIDNLPDYETRGSALTEAPNDILPV